MIHGQALRILVNSILDLEVGGECEIAQEHFDVVSAALKRENLGGRRYRSLQKPDEFNVFFQRGPDYPMFEEVPCLNHLNEKHVVGLYDLTKLTKDELIRLIDVLRERNNKLLDRVKSLTLAHYSTHDPVED